MELRRLGLITVEKQLLTTPDWKGVERYAGFDPTYLPRSRRLLRQCAAHPPMAIQRLLASVELEQV
jgi:hypothetical protein